ncbi:MAG: phosphoenolpyruvate--protein phosphotransferase [Ruminococcaceae bacterium]|nr:phosphoenolpyruvate--protein phosphotransferase [Oscillospiraceae bacterium]
MTELFGKGVSNGYAIGKICFMGASSPKIKKKTIRDTKSEIVRLEMAVNSSLDSLDSLYREAVSKVGQTEAEIFNIHKMMLEDDDYQTFIKSIITTELVCAEYAVSVAKEKFADMFSSMEDTYMQERAKDVRDVSDRLIRKLMGKEDNPSLLSGIIAAEDLAPSQTITLDKSKVSAFITQKGSSNSHTAILARGMNIPAVCALGDSLSDDFDGKTAIVDGFSGKITIDPPKELILKIQQEIKNEKESSAIFRKLIGKPTVTTDGTKINLFSNIGGLSDIESVINNDSEGIGLFRSEFIFLGRNSLPTEDEQFEIYRSVAEKMKGKKVIIRTLDIGADKNAPYLPQSIEENPAMGLRAIRFCLFNQDIFKSQLRAILRASIYGNISIMFPMIISKSEIISTKKILFSAMSELSNDGIPYNNDIETGIMIETPAAALLSDILADEVDFFSIGTNDLTQYTLAVDRQNSAVSDLIGENQSAVLKLISMTAFNGRKAGIWVGVCGEMASDLSLTEFFIKSGINELSVSPHNTLRLRKKIREI